MLHLRNDALVIPLQFLRSSKFLTPKLIMAVSNVLQICPTIETLFDCTKGRPKSSLKDVKKVYHCPIETCKYFKSEFYFEKMKFLKQHFVKVHKAKSFSCPKCGLQFPLETTLNRHKLICGVNYRCHCNAQYKAYEALMTHVKRKHHGSALKYKDMMECLKVHSMAQRFQKHCDNAYKVKAIIVKDQNQQKLLYVKQKQKKSASSKETQTGMKMCKILPNVSSQTQTSEQFKKTVSMQTLTDSGTRRRKRSKIQGNVKVSNSSSDNVTFMSSSTQTFPITESQFTVHPRALESSEQSKHNVSEKSSFDKVESSPADVLTFEDTSDNSNLSLPLMYTNMKSFTDPNLGSVIGEGSCSTVTQTDFNSIEMVMSDLLKTEPNLIMCSDSETQTVFEDIFDSSCIDTYTQTCDSLFSDLDFVDIQTQTSWSMFDDNTPET